MTMSGECNICGQDHAELRHCAFKDLFDELQAENAATIESYEREATLAIKLRDENERLKEQLAVIREMASIEFADNIIKLTDQFLPPDFTISRLRFEEILREQKGAK